MESETLRAETGTTKEVANGMLKKMRKIFFLPLGELGRDVSIALLLESKAPPNLLLEDHNVITLMNSVGWKLGWSPDRWLGWEDSAGWGDSTAGSIKSLVAGAASAGAGDHSQHHGVSMWSGLLYTRVASGELDLLRVSQGYRKQASQWTRQKPHCLS